MGILRETIATTQSVANAMAAVVDYWEGHPDDVTRRFGCRNSVEAIEMLYQKVNNLLSSSKDYILENWSDIVHSSIRMNEVRLYLAAVKDFFGTLRTFENEFCENDYKAFATFDDAWIARKYFVMMLDQSNLYNCVFEEFSASGNSRPTNARPFRGIARAFEDYFSGVNDVQIEDLIVNHRYFARPALWKGLRAEAVIFAKAFGLSASDMNHCFIIPGKHSPHRNLGLVTDRPSKTESEYGICAAIDLYKHCRV